MQHNISLQGPHARVRDSFMIGAAYLLRERANSVKADLLAAPTEHVQLDTKNSNEGLGCYRYQGSIGTDGFASVHTSQENGKLQSFAAHDPKAAPGETIKFHYTTSQATGFRAGIASSLGAISGGLGHAGCWFLAQAMTADSKVGSMAYEMASKPLILASDLTHLVEKKVADPGTKDEYYAISKANGDYEQYLFTADNRLECDIFPKPKG